jgi:excisionase family DNA binding protein
VLTVREAAARSGASASTIYELCRAGRLVHYRIGCRGRGKILIDPKSLADFVAACRVDGPARGELEGQKFIRP